jgi:hypothetical protein
MSKAEELSDKAKAAKTTEDIWSLFFTDAILDTIVQCTNQKIDEDILRANYSREDLLKQTYIRHLDKVSLKEECSDLKVEKCLCRTKAVNYGFGSYCKY